MNPCAQWSQRLVERASGTLDAAAATAVDDHLTGCAGCRDELAALTALLTSAVMPPTADDGFAARTLAAWERERTRGSPRRLAAVAVAAGVAAGAFFAGTRVDPGPATPGPAALAGEVQDAETYDALEAWARTSDPLADELAVTSLPEASTEDDADMLDSLLEETDG